MYIYVYVLPKGSRSYSGLDITRGFHGRGSPRQGELGIAVQSRCYGPVPSTTITVMFVGSCYTGSYRNYRQPTKTMAFVEEALGSESKPMKTPV